MKSFEKILAYWWARILLFGILLFILDNILSLYIGSYEFYSLRMLLIALIPGIVIDALRVNHKFYLFGIMLNSFTIREMGFGLLLAVVNMIILFIPAYLITTNFSVQFYLNKSLYLLIIDYLFLAAFEEFLFRGVVYQAVYEKFGKAITVLLFSLIFALVHFENNNFNAIFFGNLFLAGMLFSIMYIQTRSLWLPISFHFFWNLFENLFLGSSVSGTHLGNGFINLDIASLNVYFFGGAYGIEAGLITTFVLLINILLVLKFAKISPHLNAQLFKRYYEESEILYNNSVSK